MANLLKIRDKRNELIAQGIKPGVYSDEMFSAINGLIDVEVDYLIYLYKDISSKPNVIKVKSLTDIEEMSQGYYMREVFQKERAKYLKVEKNFRTSTLLERKLMKPQVF